MSGIKRSGPPKPARQLELAPGGDRLILGITSGGTNDDGVVTAFTFKFANDSEKTFLIDTAAMPKMMTALNQCLRMAQDKRAEAGAGDEFETSPMEVTSISKSGRNSEANLVALQLQTREGIPLDLAMAPNIACRRNSMGENERRLAAMEMAIIEVFAWRSADDLDDASRSIGNGLAGRNAAGASAFIASGGVCSLLWGRPP
jgi:hypothetical protein